jgi:hypothetical protein
VLKKFNLQLMFDEKKKRRKRSKRSFVKSASVFCPTTGQLVGKAQKTARRNARTF